MGKKNKSSSKTSGSSSEALPEVIPEEFKKVTLDFICDISTTFPEYAEKLAQNFTTVCVEKEDGTVSNEHVMIDEKIIALYEYSKKGIPF